MLEILGLILPGITKILDKVIPDADKRAEAQEAVTKLLLENQNAILQASKDVMVADAQSEGWLTRNARPGVVVWAMGMITWVIFSPIFGLQDATIHALQRVPDSLWNLVMVGIGGYMLAKTVENTVKTAARSGRP